jgi:histidine ammonia-lyase
MGYSQLQVSFGGRESVDNEDTDVAGVVLDGDSFTVDDLVAVARQGTKIQVAEAAWGRVADSRRIVDRLIADGVPVYGVTTGFGALQDRIVPPEQLEALQENLILSHAAGVGPEMPKDAVRAMITLRANTLVKGYSGVRVELVQALIDLVNNDVIPIVPIQGSVGSSGDLAPLAHMASVLIGRGSAYYRGEKLSGARALESAGLRPLRLQAKEGLALTNGTQFMTAVGALALSDAKALAKCADIAAVLTLEALKGKSSPFRTEVGMLRRHVGQSQVADNVRMLIVGSRLIDREDKDTQGKLQDAYSLRCTPQVHGASRDAFEYVDRTITVEMNSTNDNPLVLNGEVAICSAGNFHGQPVALVLDHLALAVSELGNISERRCARLLDSRDNRGLPPFLTEESGLNSGLMIAQYTAAALASENKSLVHPASADSIPTSANQEDHNSMGSIAARHARAVIDNVTYVLAIEILCACQALDFRQRDGNDLGAGTKAAFDVVRSVVTTMDRDRELHADIEAVRQLILEGRIVPAVERAVGNLKLSP